MGEAYDKLSKCYKSVKKKIDFQPKVALVLGSGLGDYVKQVKVEIGRASCRERV